MFDLLLYNGRVLTMNAGLKPCATGERTMWRSPSGLRMPTAVAIHNGRIAAVGNSDLRNEPATRRIDLAGRTLVPGFNDAHAHVWKIGQLRTSLLDLRGVRSLAELERRVADVDRSLPPGAWLLGRGYNEALLREGRPPARGDLDRAAPNRPVVLTRTCGHICAVNSVAMRHAGVERDRVAPPGGVIERDERGEPTGLLHETAIGLVTRLVPSPSAADYEEMIVAALKHQLSLGITASSDCGVPPQLLQVYRDMDARDRLMARMNVMPLRRVDGVALPIPLPQRHVSDMLRVDTAKFLADGGLSGATAALSVPYRHADSSGVLRFDEHELMELCRETHDAGWRIATHAIGDVAIDQVLRIYERLGPHPRGCRHRIEHFGLPDASQLAHASRLRVIAAPQPVFLYSLGRNFRKYLPEAFLPRTYPIRAMLDAGVPVALSSDAPVIEDDNPLLGMSAAIIRRDDEGHPIAPEQAITIEEALYAYTMGGALASGDEDTRGSIEVGKCADLAVLSENPLNVEPEALPQIKVEMTLIAGRKVFER